ncbi:MAG: hypothetical protein ACI4L7_03800 [Christensenellales bacterium]
MQGDLIVEKILTDAKIQAEELMQKAQEQVEKMQQEENAWQKSKSQETEKRLKQKDKEMSLANNIKVNIECKKMELESKKNMIENIKLKAYNEMCSMKKTGAKALFEKLLKNNAEEGDILLWRCDSLAEKDILSLPTVKKLSLEVKMGEEEGIFLCGKKCDKNLLFKTLIESYIEENLKEICEMLS